MTAPMRFGAYAPENFDDAFHGTVTVRTALQQSLNVPALQVLDAVGPDRLIVAHQERRRRAGAAEGRRARPRRGPRRRRRPPHRSRHALRGAGARRRSLPLDLARRGPRDGRNAAPPVRSRRRLAGGRCAASARRCRRTRSAARSPSRPAPPTATAMPGRSASTARMTIAVWVGRPDGARGAGPRRAPRRGADPVRSLPAHRPGAHAAGAAAAGRRLRAHDRTAGRTCSASVRAACPRSRPQRRAIRRSPSPFRPTARGSILPEARMAAVALKASAGRRPSPGSSTACRSSRGETRREALWESPGKGFARLSVIDAKGATASASVRVE